MKITHTPPIFVIFFRSAVISMYILIYASVHISVPRTTWTCILSILGAALIFDVHCYSFPHTFKCIYGFRLYSAVTNTYLLRDLTYVCVTMKLSGAHSPAVSRYFCFFNFQTCMCFVTIYKDLSRTHNEYWKRNETKRSGNYTTHVFTLDMCSVCHTHTHTNTNLRK